MQRTLVARSVDFGRRKQRKSSEREEAFKRLSARPAQQARGKGGGKAERLLRYGSLDDARNCLFKPKTILDPNGESKADEDQGERKTDNFVQRQEAWNRKVRKEKAFCIGKKDYDARLDKKQCPSCTAVQAYDEFAEKRNLCVECAVEYVRPNLGGVDRFLRKLDRYAATSRRNLRDIERYVREDESRASKLVVRGGRTVRVPLFTEAEGERAWDAFFDRMDADLHRREAQKRLLDVEDVTERLARNVPLTSENAELLRQCTFEPHLFTKGPYTYPDPRHGAEPKGEFHERLDADRGRREAKSCSFAREERDTKRWFDTHAALRDPHVSHGGKPRVIPDAKW